MHRNARPNGRRRCAPGRGWSSPRRCSPGSRSSAPALLWRWSCATARGGRPGVLGSAIGGPFQLVDQNGQTVTNTDLEGKWLLVYFGYTHCPDACPTALNNIALALSDLGAEKKEIRPVFITVDPERDTSQALKDYVAAFGAPILALTGSAAAIDQAAKEYRVYYAKHPEPGGDYSMDHTSIIYVMDPKGRFTASFTGDDPPEQIAARLKKLLT